MAYSNAAVYDAIYTAMKDYKAEAGVVKRLIGTNLRNKPKGRISLLDAATGTGLHLEHFEPERFDAEGFDASSEQLGEAFKRLLPLGVRLHQADMRFFSLPRKYHAITCLFSAIGHMQTMEDLQLAITTMADHLWPGGVLLVEPWISPDMWVDGGMHADFVNTPTLKVARMCDQEGRGRIVHLTMHYMVLRAGHPVELFDEEHVLLMTSHAEMFDVFKTAGLQATFDPAGISSNGRGVYIGRKPLS